MTNIAIIEDDPVINQMYRMKFEASGFTVFTASDGEAGVELVKKTNPDIILLDIQMPHMHGDEALGLIRKLPDHKTTPVIILTNVGKEEAPQTLKSLGVSSYIVKAELTPSQVVARVKETLGIS
jgi:DNA-binding response OmpR family regulator